MKNPITQSVEDYLERIHQLIEEKGYARVSDIAKALGLSRPSVSVMVQRLDRLGLLDYEKYRGLRLTKAGREAALRIRRRHATLTEFFTLLEIAPDIIERDVEGIEHHISSETLRRIELLVAHWQATPAALRAVLDRDRKSQAAKHKT